MSDQLVKMIRNEHTQHDVYKEKRTCSYSLVTSYQSPVASYQLLVTSHQLLVTSNQLLVTSYQLLVTNNSYQSLVPSHQHQLLVTSHQLLVIDHQLLVTNYQSPAVRDWSLLLATSNNLQDIFHKVSNSFFRVIFS